jgi:hypothetical protein
MRVIIILRRYARVYSCALSIRACCGFSYNRAIDYNIYIHDIITIIVIRVSVCVRPGRRVCACVCVNRVVLFTQKVVAS